uniref:Peptidase S26 domain-containing protein n=1 Tax=Ciona savignyi TaxID=51511 RepID=H2Z5P7_CIOSA
MLPNFRWRRLLSLTRKLQSNIWKHKGTLSEKTVEKTQWSTMLLTAGFTCCVVSILDDKFVTYTMVSGTSMQPCLNPVSSKSNDRVLIDRTPKWNHKKLQRGDLVIYRTTRNPD